MVPENYHDFFVASAGVAGALIGLLFVAISVSPERMAGPDADRRLQLRAAGAFSALINALVIALVALIPDAELVGTPLGLSVAGLVSTVITYLLLLREGGGFKLRDLVLQLVMFLAYATQAVAALRLRRDPNDTGALQLLASLLVVFFVIGISRAWELVGTRDRRLSASIAELRAHPTGDADRPED